MKILKLIICICLLFDKGNCQDVINPYANYSGSPMPQYDIMSSGYNFNTIINSNSSSYNGEYMIQFDLLWWFNNYPSGGGNFDVQYHKSYKLEVVGFPFMLNCAWNSTGCSDGLSVRTLEMPNNSLSNNQWGTNLWRVRDNIQINPASKFGEESRLISNEFRNAAPMALTGIPYYPHTAHKYTLYIHCGPDPNDEKADSLIFYVDLTRGRMRDYPFVPSNELHTGLGSSHWDVVMRPRIIYKNYGTGHSYNETTNDGIYPNGKTLDYFSLNNNCFYVDPSIDYFFDPPGDFNFTKPAPYILTSNLLYSGFGYNTLAGYSLTTNNMLNPQVGIEHKYSIQNNINLEEINPNEKVIYNPSEVDITASNLIFPSHYIFKTIRGIYPTEAEADADNLNSDNGGPYLDKLDIPVTTDLYSMNSADPVNDHVYASRYYLKPGSVITIRPCVGLFDATFDIEAGATLIFDDYDQIIGKEDKNSFNGRYKLQGLGGAILRNNTDIQFIQNGDIFQTTPLNYIASSHIIAGKNVDPDTDQPDGIYEIKAGAIVTFNAGDYIHLTDGFYVSGGDFHAVIDENMAVPVLCNTNNSQNGGNRVQQQSIVPKPRLSNYITVSPNPSIGQFDITMSGDGKMNSVSVFDLVGRRVYYSTNLNEKSHQINLQPQIKGPMIVEVISNADEIKRVKIIVE